MDVALESENAGAIELAVLRLPLVGLAEIEDVGAGWFAGAVVNFGVNIVKSAIAIDDLEGNAGLDGDDVRIVTAAELFHLNFRESGACVCGKLGIGNPDDDIGEFALGADLPVFGVADGAFPTAGGSRDEGFVLAFGLALKGDEARDIGACGLEREEADDENQGLCGKGEEQIFSQGCQMEEGGG